MAITQTKTTITLNAELKRKLKPILESHGQKLSSLIEVYLKQYLARAESEVLVR